MCASKRGGNQSDCPILSHLQSCRANQSCSTGRSLGKKQGCGHASRHI